MKANVPFDENILNNTDLDQVDMLPGGRKPKPITSSWPEFSAPHPRRTAHKFFIDAPDGTTIGECSSASSAMQFMDKHGKNSGLTVRVETLDEERLQDEDRLARSQARYANGFGG